MIQLQLHVKAPFEVITMYMTLSLSHIFYSFYLFHQDNFDYEPNPISNENNTNIKIRNGIYENYIQSQFFVKHRVCEIKINEILRNICSIFIHEQLLILSNKDGNEQISLILVLSSCILNRGFSRCYDNIIDKNM